MTCEYAFTNLSLNFYAGIKAAEKLFLSKGHYFRS